MDQADSAPVFEAVIVPHRSLTRRGVVTLIAVLATLCGLVGLRFWLIGAWPVACFGVVEIGLAAFLLLLNARRARAAEGERAPSGLAECTPGGAARARTSATASGTWRARGGRHIIGRGRKARSVSGTCPGTAPAAQSAL